MSVCYFCNFRPFSFRIGKRLRMTFYSTSVTICIFNCMRYFQFSVIGADCCCDKTILHTQHEKKNNHVRKRDAIKPIQTDVEQYSKKIRDIQIDLMSCVCMYVGMSTACIFLLYVLRMVKRNYVMKMHFHGTM